MSESSGVGVMGYGDDEFMAHRAGCSQCRSTTGYIDPHSTSYRPHTGRSDCWCCRNHTVRICQIDTRIWKQLDAVEYI